MKTFKCVFLSSTQSGPNPFWKGALQIHVDTIIIIIIKVAKI